MARPIIPVEERFMSKVRKEPNGCWVWTICRDKDGYGRFTVNGRSYRAHQFARELFMPTSRRAGVVMHTCDNRACVNPAHLVVGTQESNLRDMARKGRGLRSRSGLPYGVRHETRFKLAKPYYACFKHDGTSTWLGSYATIAEAAAAASDAKRRYYDAAEGKEEGRG